MEWPPCHAPGTVGSVFRLVGPVSVCCDCSVIPVKELVLWWLPCQAPGAVGQGFGLVGLVSAYCDGVRADRQRL